MPVSFSPASGRSHESVNIVATALTANTAYVVTVTNASGQNVNLQMQTDGAGAATIQFTPQHRGAATLTYQLKTVAAAGSGANTFTGV